MLKCITIMTILSVSFMFSMCLFLVFVALGGWNFIDTFTMFVVLFILFCLSIITGVPAFILFVIYVFLDIFHNRANKS